MSRALVMIPCIAGGLFAAAIALQGQTVTWQPPNAAGEGQSPMMPVHEEPHHRQVFRQGPMRLIELQIPPGDASWFHLHEWPVFYLTVADSQTRTQLLGEEWGAGRGRAAGPGARAGAPPAGAAPGGPAPAAAPPAGAPAGAPAAGPGGAPGGGRGAAPPGARAAGAPGGGGGAPGAGGGRGAAPAAGGARTFRPRLFSDISYAERAVTHRIENIGTGLYRALGVINETQGGDESVTEEAAGFTGKAEMTNRWFRIHRVALAPGQKVSHQHKAPVVLLQDSAGTGLATAPPMLYEYHEPGSWGFFDTGVRHEISNTGTAPMEYIEVEVRRK